MEVWRPPALLSYTRTSVEFGSCPNWTGWYFTQAETPEQLRQFQNAEAF